jgi:hypothetical protein
MLRVGCNKGSEYGQEYNYENDGPTDYGKRIFTELVPGSFGFIKKHGAVAGKSHATLPSLRRA